MLAFADPKFDIPSATPVNREPSNVTDRVWRHLIPLPETAMEVRAVAKSLNAREQDIFLQGAATETLVKTIDLAKYRVIYFATHGLVAGQAGRESAIVLSRPNFPSLMDDGFLEASEVAKLQLNAEWVVLSACDTASGDSPGWEALSGLVSAFFYAGTRSVLATHMPVETNAAVHLTTTMFRTKAEDPSLSAAEALRRAMLTYLTEEEQHPKFWAPFTLFGSEIAQGKAD